MEELWQLLTFLARQACLLCLGGREALTDSYAAICFIDWHQVCTFLATYIGGFFYRYFTQGISPLIYYPKIGLT